MSKFKPLGQLGDVLIALGAIVIIIGYAVIGFEMPWALYVTGVFVIIPLVPIFVVIRYLSDIDQYIQGLIVLIPSVVELAVYFLVWPFRNSIFQLVGSLSLLIGSILSIISGLPWKTSVVRRESQARKGQLKQKYRNHELCRLRGVGPFTVESDLIRYGITSLEQLASLTDEELESLAQRTRGLVSRKRWQRYRDEAQDLLKEDSTNF